MHADPGQLIDTSLIQPLLEIRGDEFVNVETARLLGWTASVADGDSSGGPVRFAWAMAAHENGDSDVH